MTEIMNDKNNMTFSNIFDADGGGTTTDYENSSWLLLLLSSVLGESPEVLMYMGKVGLYGGIQLALATLILTVVLELTSLGTVRALCNDVSGGKNLYYQAIRSNILNHFFFGVPVYSSALLLFGRRPSSTTGSDTDSSLLQAYGMFAFRTFCMTVVHGISYYHVHKAFHEYPKTLYKFHKFHHQYNTNVPVMAANAVSAVEYLLAYVLPFGLACIIVRPSEMEFRISVYLVSISNLLIHTSAMERTASIWAMVLPSFLEPYFVSTAMHTKHHRQLHVHYGASIFNMDYITNKLQTIIQMIHDHASVITSNIRQHQQHNKQAESKTSHHLSARSVKMD